MSPDENYIRQGTLGRAGPAERADARKNSRERGYFFIASQ